MGGAVESIMRWQSASEELDYLMMPDNIEEYAQRPPMYAPVAAQSPEDGYSPAYRMNLEGYGDTEHQQCQDTFYHGALQIEQVRDVCANQSQAEAVAYRRVLKVTHETVEEHGKTREMPIHHVSEPNILTYGAWWELVEAFGRGLVALGISAGAKVAIFEETRYEWLVSCYGLWTQHMTVATVYANLGPHALRYALQELECRVMLCNGKSVPDIVQLLSAHNMPFPIFIFLDDLPASWRAEGEAQHAVTTIPWSDVIAQGKNVDTVASIPLQFPTAEALALIMYTSGTTGDPKGVMLTHGAISAAVKAFQQRIAYFYGPHVEDETYVAFLPLAHIFEQTIEGLLLLRGSRICYGTPRTITDQFTRPCGDFTCFQPHFMIGVPRVLDTVQKIVVSKLPPEGSLKRRIFELAYADALAKKRLGRSTPYWDRHAFAAARRVFGPRMLGMVIGGGPLSSSTQDFVRVVFGVLCVQGYGLTETCAIATTQLFGDMSTGHIGSLIMGAELRLKDTAIWKHTDTIPCGELCLRGPFLSCGYYKQPELTKQTFVDGWLHTGDIGQLDARGNVKIIGRIKALAKNALGEYIPLEALESIYAASSICTPAGVCVVVRSDSPYLVALVLTDEVRGKAFAKKHGFQPTDWPHLLQKQDFVKAATDDLVKTAKEAGRLPFEWIRTCCLLTDEWTTANGALTAATKLIRSTIEERYQAQITSMFAALQAASS